VSYGYVSQPINQTVLPATLQIPDPSCNMRASRTASSLNSRVKLLLAMVVPPVSSSHLNLVNVKSGARQGDVEKTLYWMEQARDARLPWYLATFSYFTAPRSLHQEPRMQALAEEAGIPMIPFPKD
jgi:hypothetical protein